MNFYILTLFPEMVYQGLNHSMIKRAVDNNIININCIDIRDFSGNKHKSVDDYPFGGGAGMLMRAEPIYNAYKSIEGKISKDTKVIYMSPQGKPYNQKIVESLSIEEDIVIICGRYEGIDERLIEEIVDMEISIGDYILSGGELGAMVMVDTISRLIPGVLGKAESYEEESFSENLLEYPQYTRPRKFLDREVPEILLSGNHGKIEKWRREQAIKRTKERRPDLLDK